MTERDPWALQRGALAAARLYELREPAAHVLLYMAVRADGVSGLVGPIGLETVLGEVRLAKSAFYVSLKSLRDLTLVAPGVAAAPGRLPVYRLCVSRLLDLNVSATTETSVSAQTEALLETAERFRVDGLDVSAQTEPVLPKEQLQEVNLSEGSSVVAREGGAGEVPHHLHLIQGKGKGTDTGRRPILSATHPEEAVALAGKVHAILNGGFVGLTEPKPSWKRPSVHAVLGVLGRCKYPGAIIVERAAHEARRTLQQREDGRNVVGLFEYKLRGEIQKLAAVHEQVAKSFGLDEAVDQ